MSKWLRISVGLLVSFFCLWIVFRKFDFISFEESIKTVSWMWVFMSFMVYIFCHLLRSYRWKTIVSPIAHIGMLDLFPILMLGFLVNNLLPARAGEFARAMALKKKINKELPVCLSTIALERFFDMACFMITFLILIPFLPANLLKVNSMALTFLVVGSFVVGIFLLSLLLKKKNSENFLFKKIHHLVDQIKSGFMILQSPKIISGLFCLTLLVISIELLNIFFLSRAFHLNLSYVQSGALFIAIIFGVAIPASPGSIGTFEFFSQQMLVKMSFPATQALSFVVFLHLYYVLVNCLLGLTYFLIFARSAEKTPELATNPIS